MPKLTPVERLQVVRWLIERRGQVEIVGLVKEAFKKDIRRESIWLYEHGNKWGPIIRRGRAQFDLALAKIPIANKSVRLRILNKAAIEGTRWHFNGTDPAGKKKYKMNIGAAVAACDKARVEMEGDKPGIVVGDGGKVVFQDIKIEGKPVGDIVKDINNRLSSQFTR